MHVIDVFESGDDLENDMRTVTLWKQTNMEGGGGGGGVWDGDGM